MLNYYKHLFVSLCLLIGCSSLAESALPTPCLVPEQSEFAADGGPTPVSSTQACSSQKLSVKTQLWLKQVKTDSQESEQAQQEFSEFLSLSAANPGFIPNPGSLDVAFKDIQNLQAKIPAALKIFRWLLEQLNLNALDSWLTDMTQYFGVMSTTIQAIVYISIIAIVVYLLYVIWQSIRGQAWFSRQQKYKLQASPVQSQNTATPVLSWSEIQTLHGREQIAAMLAFVVKQFYLDRKIDDYSARTNGEVFVQLRVKDANFADAFKQFYLPIENCLYGDKTVTSELQAQLLAQCLRLGETQAATPRI